MNPKWYFDETQHAGVDYGAAGTARDYDEQHRTFRNYEEEARQIAGALELDGTSVVLDMGCGTGGIALNMAPYCSRVIAVDISRSMLDVLTEKAETRHIKNVETHCAGFLTYEHASEPVDCIITKAALHHLPDFWKSVALLKMAEFLKPEGKLYLFDVVFPFHPKDHRKYLERWIDGMRAITTEKMAAEAVIHIRDEFSTFDWILEGMIERAGFVIESKKEEQLNCFSYLCGKSRHRRENKG